MKKGYKHFNKCDRDQIEKMIDQDMSAVNIAAHLGKSERAVSYEVKNHRTQYPSKLTKCSKVNECRLKNICHDCPRSLWYHLCKSCKYRSCSSYCDEFTREILCSRLRRFPYVCNACENRSSCKADKYFYKSNRADEQYQFNVSDHKKGPAIPLEKFIQYDNQISESVKNGHSITAAIEENGLDIHPSTVYKYVHNGQMHIHEIDLPYQVRYKSRRKKGSRPVYRTNYDCLMNRRYEDFVKFLTANPGLNLWQMDTVAGIVGKEESCLLSLLFVPTNLQLYFKLQSKSVIEVNKVFRYIKRTLGNDLYKETFSIILTDNGSEFKDPKTIEIDEETGEQLVHVFYCHPRRSDEKGDAERNHRELRRMVPQGISWNPYTDQDILHISNTVNNYYRPQFKTSPYSKSIHLLDKRVMALNDLSYLPPEKVVLKQFYKQST